MDSLEGTTNYQGGSASGAEADIRVELCDFSARLKQRGLTSSMGGNVSYRVGGDMWISPTGCVLDEITVEDWVKVNLETGKAYPHPSRPSSEVVMHREIFLVRPDVNAIFHSHPPYVIALSLVGIEIKPIGSESPVVFGDRVPLVPYEIPTTPLLAHAVARYAHDFDVMMLENHGLIALGKTNREAYNRTELAEELAKIMCIAYSLGKGEPNWPTPEDFQQYRNWHFNKKLPG